MIPRTVFSALLAFSLAAPAAAAQSLADKLEAIMDRDEVAGMDWSILVENETGDRELYSHTPELFLAPASNTKMFTTAAALGLLGKDYVFETYIYHTGNISGGNVSGDLVILSEHDPTWNTSTLEDPSAGFVHIADRLYERGLRSVAGGVAAYGACITGYGSTTNRTRLDNQPAWNEEVATQLRTALIERGISVEGEASGHAGFDPPEGATLYHTHYSNELEYRYSGNALTLEEICVPLNRVSNNPMAELVLRHIGYKLSGEDTFEAGARHAIAWFRDEAGISGSEEIVMNDGSGLSWGNRFNARQTIDLSRYMAIHHPEWERSMPIGCVTGTIRNRFCDTVAAERVFAKTGTLSISIALSGWLEHPIDGERYYFSLLANRRGIDRTGTRQALDDMVVALAEETPVIDPQMLQVTSAGDGRIHVRWTHTGAPQYHLARSTDGMFFSVPVPVPAPETYLIESNDGGRNYDDYSSTPTGSQAIFTPTGIEPGGYDVFARLPGDDEASLTAVLRDTAGVHRKEISLHAGWTRAGSIDFTPGQGHGIVLDAGENQTVPPRLAVKFVPETATFIDQWAQEGNTYYYRVSLPGGRTSLSEGIQPGGGQ